MLPLLITHLNPSSSENLLLAISDLTRLEMRLSKFIIDYMSRVRGISQRTKEINIEGIIPIFSTVIIDHDRYPGVKSHYLAGDAVLVNCDLLQLSSLLSDKETRQHALGIPSAPPFTTTANCVSKTPTNSPPAGNPTLQPPQPPTQSPTVVYPPARGVPWKCIATMMREDKSCPGCHFNYPEDSQQLKFHQEVGCLAIVKHGYIFRKDVTASEK